MSVTRLFRFSLIFLVAALTGCRGYAPDPRLSAAADSIDVNPKRAAELIEAVDPASLRADDRHYRDLLTIKAADKAYVTHKSDTTILRLIDWARGCGNDHILTEALYYGGRVYADLGDYPTALRYYQDALDRLPPDNSDINLRANVLSQISYVFYVLKLFNQAIPCLTESIAIDHQLSDTFGLVYDHEYLGLNYIELGEFNKGINHLRTAYQFAQKLNDYDIGNIQLNLANAFYLSGNNESALSLLYNLQELLRSNDKIDAGFIEDEELSYYNAIAAEIFYNVAKYDSSYICAKRLLSNSNPNRRIAGYRLLLKPEIRGRFNADSLENLVSSYINAINEDYSKREMEAIVFQNSRFNYYRYQLENDKLYKTRDNMQRWIIVLNLGIIVLASFIIVYKNRERKKKLKLQQTLFELSELNSQLVSEQSLQLADQNADAKSKDRINNETNDLNNYSESGVEKKTVIWSDTEAYNILRDLIDSGKPLNDSDKRWDVIMDCINENAPNYFGNLQKNSCAKLTLQDRHLAAMILMGFSPSETAVIIGLVKGAISYRRNGLIKKLFENRVTLKNLDATLRSI